MFNSSGRFALGLSGSLAILTTAFLSIFQGTGAAGLVVTFIISLVVSFVVLYFSLDYFIFRDARKLNEMVRNLGSRDGLPSDEPVSIRPLQTTANDLQTFASATQKEIDDLRKLEAFRKDFVADVSHELKTPIFAAQGFVHTLLDGAVKDKSVRKKFLKKAARSLDSLDILVQDLLTLSQIETGQIKMRFNNIDMYALTEEVFEQFGAKPNKKEVTLRIEGPVRKVMVYADWLRISQVMSNLISNAINHSEAHSEVVVSFSVKKKSVITRVKDFGTGIAEEHINRIFERFYRVDKSRSREKGGTGLGLAIVKHILDGHHTRPEVESTPGKGSTFSFRLGRGGNAGDQERETENNEND